MLIFGAIPNGPAIVRARSLFCDNFGDLDRRPHPVPWPAKRGEILGLVAVMEVSLGLNGINWDLNGIYIYINGIYWDLVRFIGIYWDLLRLWIVFNRIQRDLFIGFRGFFLMGFDECYDITLFQKIMIPSGKLT